MKFQRLKERMALCHLLKQKNLSAEHRRKVKNVDECNEPLRSDYQFELMATYGITQEEVNELANKYEYNSFAHKWQIQPVYSPEIWHRGIAALVAKDRLRTWYMAWCGYPDTSVIKTKEEFLAFCKALPRDPKEILDAGADAQP